MKTLDYLHLDSNASGKTVEGLQQLLADFQIYYANLRGLHWNITGKNFFTLHSKFEEMYDDTAEKVDEIAERILMLGGTPVNNYSEYLKKSAIKEVSGVTCGEEAVKLILDTLGTIIAAERKLLAHAADANDEATVSLLSDYLTEQEKTVWMLVAYATDSCKK